jgi:Secretion system C-terminal sorting domain/FG-GAP-like repeat
MKSTALFIIINYGLVLSLNAQFAEPFMIKPNMCAFSSIPCDINNDGEMDMCISKYAYFSQIVLSIGKPNTQTIDWPLAQEIVDFGRLPDFNNDGLEDLVLRSYGANGYQLGANQGNVSFTYIDLPPSQDTTGWGQVVKDIADFNNDGLTDILRLDGWLKNNGNFEFELIPFESVLDNTIDAIDFNGDGDVDIIASIENTDVYYFENDGQGNFVSQILSDLDGSTIINYIGYSCYYFDDDNDGDIDIYYASNVLYRIERLSDYSFANQSIELNVSNANYDFFDWNGDGDLECISYEDYPTPTSFKMYEPLSTGGFDGTPIWEASIGIQNYSMPRKYVYHWDYDADGIQDLITDFGCYSVYLNNGAFQFEYGDIIYHHVLYNYTCGAGVQSQSGAVASIISDFNSDGIDDIDIWFQRGSILGRERHLIGLDGKVKSNWVLFGTELVNYGLHFHAEANIDLSSSQELLVSDDSYIRIYGQLTPNTYGELASIFVADSIFNLVPADFDGDGMIDIMYTRDEIDFAYYKYLRNLGNYQFEEVVVTPIPAQTDDFVFCFDLPHAVDFDNDGDADLIDDLAIVINLGNNEWSSDSYFFQAIWAPPIDIDLNGDGLKDILDGTYMDINEIYWNLGNGNFSEPQQVLDEDGNPLIGLDLSNYHQIDIDGDFDMDLMANYSSQNFFFILNLGNGLLTEPIEVQMPLHYVRYFANDLNEDYKMDFYGFGHIPQSENPGDYISGLYSLENRWEAIYQTKCNVFWDLNENGQLDDGEMPIPMAQLTMMSENNIGYTNTNGTKTFYSFENGIHNVSCQVPDGWAFTTPSQITYKINPENEIYEFSFGIAIDQIIDNYQFSQGFTPSICSSTQFFNFCSSNEGTSVRDIRVELTLDTNLNFINADPMPDLVENGVLTWNIIDLPVFANFCIELNTDTLPTGLNSDSLITNIHIVTLDELSNEIQVYNNLIIQPVLCSFDPNVKQEHNGVTESGFIDDSNMLEYTVQFQNTGNYPATNVVIRDQLSEWLDWSSLNPLAWSHPVEIEIDENGLAIFKFTNIMLPDSMSDEAESHGFITYRISPILNIPDGTTIENFALIFFDSNDPVVTNTTINTIIDCDLFPNNIELELTGDCNSLTFNASAINIWSEEYTWLIDGEIISNSAQLSVAYTNPFWLEVNVNNLVCGEGIDSIYVESINGSMPQILANDTIVCEDESIWLFSNFEVGNVWMINDSILSNSNAIEIENAGIYSLTVQQGNCLSNTDDIEIVEIPNPNVPIITQVGNTISIESQTGVYYQWYFDNQPIIGANSEFFTINASGLYAVEVSSVDGCSSSNSIYCISTSVFDLANSSFCYVYPNPTAEMCNIELVGLWRNPYLYLYSITGQLIFYNNIPTSKNQIDLSSVSNGMYLLSIMDLDGNKLQTKLSVQH